MRTLSLRATMEAFRPGHFRAMRRGMFILLAFLLPAGGAAAQQTAIVAEAAAQEEDQGSLHWAEFRVEARLDADGRLHVREHQAIVFTGAWNGGEREFPSVRLGQDFQFHGVSRGDPASAALEPLVQDDDVEEVDQYDVDGTTVRWRSRLPDDPPFDGDRLDYVLDYTISNAVLAVDDGFLLDHDFLFPDRDGVVEEFSLSLTLDPAWTPTSAFSGFQEATMIPPGRSFAVRVPLQYDEATWPASVLRGPPMVFRGVLIALLTGGALLLFLRFRRRERAAGRYEPLPEVTGEEWLQEHVLRFPAEVVGAAWDRATDAAEVAGLLARLVQEGKLGNRVEESEDEGDDPVLHLELKVDRDEFDGYERELIDALFFDGRQETDTKTIKEHYEDEGFNPASTIAAALEDRVDALGGKGEVKRDWRTMGSGFAAGLVLLVAGMVIRPSDALLGVLGFAFLMILGGAALGIASAYARRVVALRTPMVWMAIVVFLLVGGLAAFMGGVLETSEPGASGLSPYYHPGPLLLLALLVLGLAMVRTVLMVARPTDTTERLRLRRRMAAAESYFRTQLEQPEPALRDEWFPYLLAFGLGPKIDQWFDSFGPRVSASGSNAAAFAAGAAAGTAHGGSGSSGWTGGGVTFGGGGGFSGGGVGGSWSAAAGTIATGVSAPSSGGTAGGVASSGGGGGGGW